ncbi:hypothetical protein HY837_04190 [archaeon]|nr:hypothetical protein [archaeon]
MLEKFSQEIVASVNPLKYPLLVGKRVSSAISFLIKILLISCIFAGLLFWPQINVLNYGVNQELEKIENINVKGSVQLSEDIKMPAEKPWVYATSDEKTFYNESKVFIGPKLVKYTVYGQEYEFKSDDPWEEKREKIKPAVTYLLTFLISGVVSMFLVVLFLKYLVISLFLGLIGYLLLDLTPFNVSIKKSFNTAFYSMIWIVPLEVITWPLGNNWLLPFKEIFYVKIYLIPLMLYLAVYLVSTACIIMTEKERTKLDIEWNQ